MEDKSLKNQPISVTDRDHFCNEFIQIPDYVINQAQYNDSDFRKRYYGSNHSYPSKEERQASLQVLNNHKVFIRVPIKVLPKVLADRRFKSQLETTESRGSYDPPRRKEFEDLYFGRAGCIYGYTDVAPLTSTAISYGEVCIQLKEQIRRKCTWTGGDSLVWSSTKKSQFEKVPSLLVNPHHLSLPPNVNSFEKIGGYKEIQIHDVVSVTDIDSVHIDQGLKDNIVIQEAKPKLEKLSIPLIIKVSS